MDGYNNEGGKNTLDANLEGRRISASPGPISIGYWIVKPALYKEIGIRIYIYIYVYKLVNGHDHDTLPRISLLTWHQIPSLSPIFLPFLSLSRFALIPCPTVSCPVDAHKEYE